MNIRIEIRKIIKELSKEMEKDSTPEEKEFEKKMNKIYPRFSLKKANKKLSNQEKEEERLVKKMGESKTILTKSYLRTLINEVIDEEIKSPGWYYGNKSISEKDYGTDVLGCLYVNMVQKKVKNPDEIFAKGKETIATNFKKNIEAGKTAEELIRKYVSIKESLEEKNEMIRMAQKFAETSGLRLVDSMKKDGDTTPISSKHFSVSDSSMDWHFGQSLRDDPEVEKYITKMARLDTQFLAKFQRVCLDEIKKKFGYSFEW